LTSILILAIYQKFTGREYGMIKGITKNLTVTKYWRKAGP
jgi:hypothetical protein